MPMVGSSGALIGHNKNRLGYKRNMVFPILF